MSLYQTDAPAFRRAARLPNAAAGDRASLTAQSHRLGRYALVEFPNLDGHTPATLSGYLARPDAGLSVELGGHSDGAPYPAVVVLHGCNGMFGSSAVIADRLSSWGYVTLAVDSLGPRVSGIANRCDKGLPEQAFDAYAALRSGRSSILSIRHGWPSSANRWAPKQRSMPSSITTRPRSLSTGDSVRRSPITPTATSRRQQ